MKIINANAEYMNPNDMHPYAFMEKIGRTCYKSEDKITETSAVKFVNALFKNQHTAMLEHAHIIISMTPIAVNEFVNDINELEQKNAENIDYFNITRNEKANYVSGSFRAFLNLFAIYKNEELYGVLSTNYPELFKAEYQVDSVRYRILTRTDFIDNVENTFTDNKEFADKIISKHLVHTIKFTCDRGVTHEFVRHRPASFAQESTRYCNYSKDKFGNEITVIKPHFWDEGLEPETYNADMTHAFNAWYDGCKAAEKNYFKILDAGGTPQQARDVLPTSVKTELIITATESEWQHIINLRLHGTTGAPHPQIKEVMEIAMPYLEEYSNNRLK